MKLIKVLNNSALIVEDNLCEKIVLGKGIGFALKIGDEIDETKIDKAFFVEYDNDKQNLLNLIREIPNEFLEIAGEIILYAQSILKKELSGSLYITLADHIYFVLKRYSENMLPTNPLKYDIQRFYNEEFNIGKKAVQLLEEEFEIQLNNDEAAFIAMHIVNAELETDMFTGTEITKALDYILKIIQYTLRVEIDENGIDYQRLITHVKFFVLRILKNDNYTKINPLYEIVRKNYPKAYTTVMNINKFTSTKYSHMISEEEAVYLMIHIQRLINKIESEK